MSRGCLSDEVLLEIAALLPDFSVCEELAFPLSPDSVSMLFEPESTLPIASVCLADAVQTLSGVRYALHEFHAHGRWYRGKTPPNQSAAVFFERYYLDDAAFRLYNAGEDLAAAIQDMFSVSTKDLSGYREGVTSLQATVGRYLGEKHTGEAVAEAVESLRKDSHWKDLIKYRNLVVHEQAPTMEGAGLVYDRRARWRMEGDKKVLGIGGSDPPQLTTAVLGNTVQAAAVGFIGVVETTLRTYRGLLVNTGLVEFTGDRMKVTLKFGS